MRAAFDSVQSVTALTARLTAFSLASNSDRTAWSSDRALASFAEVAASSVVTLSRSPAAVAASARSSSSSLASAAFSALTFSSQPLVASVCAMGWSSTPSPVDRTGGARGRQ